MVKSKLLALAIGASMLVGIEPTAWAAPFMESPRAVELHNFSGVKDVFLGSERRHVRREVRRFHRHERREVRRLHRHERRFVRRHM
jgi:hypothetical protein